jgi:hypothetical protein
MLVSEEDTAGERQLYEVYLPARRPSPPLHYHVAFTETFSVLHGALDLYLGPRRQHLVLHERESKTVEIRQLHTFANNRDRATEIRIETVPAGGVVKAFQLAYAVANEGGAAKDGLPRNPLLRLEFIRISQGFLPATPLSLQKAVFAIAHFIAKLAGVDKCVAAYLNYP